MSSKQLNNNSENNNDDNKINHSMSKLSIKDINENEVVNDNSAIEKDKNFNYESVLEKYNDDVDDENDVFPKHKPKHSLYTYTKRDISGYRTGMGEYIPTNHTLPLTNLAIPTPGPSDYYHDSGKSGYEYTILGRPQEKINNIGPGPASVNTRLKEKYPYWTIGRKLNYPKSI